MKIIQHIIMLIFFTNLVLTSLEASEQDPVVVVVHPSNSMTDIRKSDLRLIYQGRLKRWPDGQKIMALNLPVDSEIREKFYRRILNSTANKKFFQLGSPMPFKTSVKRSPSSVKRQISRVQNAIGFIPLSEVSEKIKVLTINSKNPTTKGYILE